MRRLLVSVAAATFVLGVTAGSAPGHPPAPHRHCLLTPQGYVEVAPGVVEHPQVHETAFHNFHGHVHLGAPPTTITPIFDLTKGCETLVP
jgi:hypothetical protein